MKRPKNNQDGIAMMVVLWFLVLMLALATEFAFSTKVEVNTTRNYKEDIESYYLAKAGINLAKAELLKPALFHSIHSEHGWITGKPAQKKPENKSGEEPEPNYDVVVRKDLPLGHGTISYTITDENSKISINTANRDLLIKLLTFAGVEIGEQRDIIADSILDWIDADNNHRLNGAEEDFYKRLNPPIHPKNGEIEFLDELLKVRGMTQEILYGSEEDPEKSKGLVEFLTTYKTSAINPNTASPEVLSLLFNTVQVQDILNAREEKGYYNNTLSSHFRISSTGKMNDSRTRHKITAVIETKNSPQEKSLLIHYWNDNEMES